MTLRAEDQSAPTGIVQRLGREERDMRVVEWLVAGVALLASFFLALPK
jgi:hypothetical protein